MAEARIASSYKGVLALQRMLGDPRFPPERLDDLRASTSRWLARWSLPLAPAVTFRDECEDGHIQWRLFKPNDAADDDHIFYIHGGGLVFHSLRDYSGFLSHLAEWSGRSITAFSYPTAPENSVDNILNALHDRIFARLKELPKDAVVTLAGDSIGAYLALYLTLRRSPRPFVPLILISPVLDIARQRQSYVKYGTGYPLTAGAMRWFQLLYQASPLLRAFDPFQLSQADLAAIPRVMLFSSEFDVLRDEAFDWVANAKARGLNITHSHFDDLCHDFCLHAGAVVEASHAVRLIARNCAGSRTTRCCRQADTADLPS